MFHLRALISGFVILAVAPAFAATTIVTQSINSPHQSGPTTLSVITPDGLDRTTTYRVLYILPVEPGTEYRYGSGLDEAAKGDIANTYQVICVAPTFTALPWFGNHPTDATLQHERHFIETVLPWVEEHYPVDESPAGRLLLGFSKSGNGALSLLLRHPELFGKAVAWDAPLDKVHPDQFGMIDIFGTDENFQDYALPKLLRNHASPFMGKAPRVILLSMGPKGHKMETVHQQLVGAAFPHIYEETAVLQHHWNSGWFPRAAALVLANTTDAR